MQKFFLVFSLFLMPHLCATGASARSAEFWRSEVERYTAEKQWAKALELFREQHKAGTELSGTDAYNYGTVALRAGAAGEAYVLLLKAALASPFDSDTKHNLLQARQRVPAVAVEAGPASWIPWWPLELRALPLPAWLLLSLLFLPAFLWPLYRNRRPQPWQWSMAALFFFALAGGALSAWQTREPAAGLLQASRLYSGPAKSYPEIRPLEAGTLVNLEETKEGWAKVRLKTASRQESVGWVELPSVLRLGI